MPTVYSDEAGPFFRNIQLMAEVKHSLLEAGMTTPIVVAGGINAFERAERLLRNKSGDIVAAARQSLADPDWFKNARGQRLRYPSLHLYKLLRSSRQSPYGSHLSAVGPNRTGCT